MGTFAQMSSAWSSGERTASAPLAVARTWRSSSGVISDVALQLEVTVRSPARLPLTVTTRGPNILSGNHKLCVTVQSCFAPFPRQFNAALGKLQSSMLDESVCPTDSYSTPTGRTQWSARDRRGCVQNWCRLCRDGKECKTAGILESRKRESARVTARGDVPGLSDTRCLGACKTALYTERRREAHRKCHGSIAVGFLGLNICLRVLSWQSSEPALEESPRGRFSST